MCPENSSEKDVSIFIRSDDCTAALITQYCIAFPSLTICDSIHNLVL